MAETDQEKCNRRNRDCEEFHSDYMGGLRNAWDRGYFHGHEKGFHGWPKSSRDSMDVKEIMDLRVEIANLREEKKTLEGRLLVLQGDCKHLRKAERTAIDELGRVKELVSRI